MSSKNPTNRPRKVAGSGAKRAQPASDEPEVVEEVAQQPSRDLASEAATEPDDTTLEHEPQEEPAGSSRATVVLVGAIVLLVAVALLEVAYLWGPLRDDPQVSSDRPVLLSTPSHRSAVDTAKVAAEKITARSYQTYDEQVDEATALMTTTFAEKYRETTDEVRDAFIAAETEVTVAVEAQAVMSASDQQVEALIFLTQYTAKAGADTSFTPYRIKVTLIDTADGWLVSDVETA